mmetsp:Transcript_103961/g.189377  ORF Transcript_103961/g.189377 Transcript_103961/m.189377 type:complete len:585 (+) Transcript_103961:72-1826(+)
MGEGQSKPTNGSAQFNKGKVRERKPVERKEDLEAKDFADLQRRCVPKALQEERKPRNTAVTAPPPTATPTAAAPPATPTAQTSAGPPSPTKQPAVERNLVRTDSQILRASGNPAERRLVRSNSNLVVPVAKVSQQQVLVRSNSSIILSSGAVQAQAAQNFQRSDSNVISATVAAAQAQNNMVVQQVQNPAQRATSLVIQKPQPKATATGQVQSQMGRATSLMITTPVSKAPSLLVPGAAVAAKPDSSSLVPPVGGYPKSFALPAKAPPTTQSFVKTTPAASVQASPAASVKAPPAAIPTISSQTSSRVPAIAGAPPLKWAEAPNVAQAPSSLRVMQAAATTISAGSMTTTPATTPGSLTMKAPVLKVRATKDERDALSRSAQLAQANQGFSANAVYLPQSTTLSATLKWTPPPEGALPQQPPLEQGASPGVQNRVLVTNLQTVQSLNIPSTMKSARGSTPTAASGVPNLSGSFTWPTQVANPAGSAVRSPSNDPTGKMPISPGNKSDGSPPKTFGTLYTRQQNPNSSPRQQTYSPDAKASEPIGGPSLIRAMAAKYQDASPRDTDAVYQNKAAIKAAMEGLQAH